MATASDTDARREMARPRSLSQSRPSDHHSAVSTDGVAGPRPVVNLSVAQIARTVTGLMWIAWAASFSASSYLPKISVLETFIVVAGLCVVGFSLTVRTQEAQRRLDVVLIAGSIALVVLLPLATAIVSGYATDELAYDQAAAASLLHGVNPYTVDFTQALQTYGVGQGATMTLHGTLEPFVTYPALSFLLYVPAVALLGGHSYAGLLVDLLAWGAAGWAMWRVLDPRLRPWVPVLLTLPALLGSIITGATDSLFVPLEIIALCTWQRFDDPDQPRWWRWAGPIALGLACCVKQQPWFLAPFLVIAVSIEAHGRGASWWRAALGYSGLVAVAFLVPNLPFIAWNPGAWFGHLLMPFTGGLVPMGIGPAGLLRPLSIGGGALVLFTVAAVATLAGLALLLCARYDTGRRLLPLLPAIALFMSARPFASYLTFCVPTLIVNAAVLRERGVVRRPRMYRPLAVTGAASLVLAVSAVAGAFAIKAPLNIQIANATATAKDVTLIAQVTNLSDRSVTPHFFLARGMYYNQTLNAVSGPAVLAPGVTARYEFTAVETPATPHRGDDIQIQAGTVAPDTISTSPVALVSG